MTKRKTAKQMERHLKGLSNHYRIQLLLLLDKFDDISLDEIIDKAGANSRTIGEHVRILARAGLVDKRREGAVVKHSLSPYGKFFTDFLKRFQAK